jgi:hypothetical protein
VKDGNLNTAAVLSAQLITDLPDASDTQLLFDLWYIRLASLTLINRSGLAAAESKVLGDLTSSFYKDPSSNAHIVPWHLRVLAVRLQALGFGEWRRGIMAYYILAEEARLEAKNAAHDENRAETRLWKARLHELGVLVANSLVEMGDLETAARHLKSLKLDRDLGVDALQKLALMESLTFLKIGDMDAAARCINGTPRSDENLTSSTSEVKRKTEESDFLYLCGVLEALAITSRGDLLLSSLRWESLNELYPDDALIQHNLAVCALYTCNLGKSQALLQKLLDSDSTPAFQSLLFNMATIYELSTENAQSKKFELVNRVAKKQYEGTIIERAPVDFKLEAR